jgi:hypothetical protein
VNSDFKDLLSLFEKHRVRYLVAGGYAVMFYSEPRYTKDLDLVVGSSEGEVERVAAALEEFGFPMTDPQVEQLKEPNQMIVLGVPPSRIDILNELTGVDFDEAWARRVSAQVADQTVCFISLQDLIKAKRAAGGTLTFPTEP